MLSDVLAHLPCLLIRTADFKLVQGSTTTLHYVLTDRPPQTLSFVGVDVLSSASNQSFKA
jgi:hypothetical protein